MRAPALNLPLGMYPGSHFESIGDSAFLPTSVAAFCIDCKGQLFCAEAVTNVTAAMTDDIFRFRTRSAIMISETNQSGGR